MAPRRTRLARGAAAVFWSSALPLGAGFAQAQSQAPPPAVVVARPAVVNLPPMLPVESKSSPPAVIEVHTQLTATDNGGLSPRGEQRSDFIASVRPQLTLVRRSARLEFELDAAATLLGYANGTQQGGVLPDLRASLKSVLVERWLYLDAKAQVRQSEADPFGTRAEQGSTANRRTEGSYRISPYIERELLPNTTLLLRHDLALTTNAAGDSTRSTTNQTLARIERRPLPLGAAAELSHLTSETGGAAGNRFTLDTGRVRGTWAATENFLVGVIAGQDRSRFLLRDDTDTLYGVSLQWQPGPRTDLSFDLEHRFFGQSGAFTFRHRMPSMSFSVSASRQPVMTSGSLGLVGQGADVRNFLDAILTTRYPDPATRLGVVDNLVTSRGLDTRGAQAIDLVANYPQLVTNVQATWAWLGARNAASVIVYSQTSRQLNRDGDPLAAAIAPTTENRQFGGSAQFNRRLMPQLSASVLARWSRISGLAARNGDVSDEKILRFSVQREVSPRTGLSAGIQHTRFATTVASQHSYDATLAFVGMSHRF